MATANHVLLRRITLTASASSVTFDSIPQTGYTDLKIVASCRTSEGQSIGPAVLQFNGVTTSYSSKELYGTGSSAASASRGVLNNGMYLGNGVGDSATSNTFGNMEIYVPGYTTSNYKSVSVDNVGEHNSTTAYATLVAGLWSSTAAITSLALYPYSGSTNWMPGSSFSLYGIADVNTTPTAAPKADGGDIIKTDGTYWYHAFTGSGVFKPQLNLTADVLVVAGGGSGGGDQGGGGGAGGVLYSSSQSLASNTSYTAAVGAGGAQVVAASRGNNGSNSSFLSMTAIGGGGGAFYGSTAGGSGGSGGGSSQSTGIGGTATSGQGYAGANCTWDTAGSGGGGAGGAGSNASVGSAGVNGGPGGAGTNTYSSIVSAVGVGSSGYIAGGGGGGGHSTGGTLNSGGAGGSGVGGNGGNYSNGTAARAVSTAGMAGTGSGGGGDGWFGQSGKSGGSGIVIIRYPV